MSHNLTRHLLYALRLTPAFVFPLLVTMPGQYALADADGTSLFGIDGTTTINVKGDELRVISVRGSFVKPRGLCNWRYDFVFNDTDGNDYYTVRGATNSGCDSQGEDLLTYAPSFMRVREGRVCARLYESGSYVDAACVHLFNSSNNPLPRD